MLSEISINRIKTTYRNMNQRCYNPNNKDYVNYGGRGITICEEWYEKVENFIGWALTHGYSDDLSIDRIDVNGNYEPSNCRWATDIEQSKNKRNSLGEGEEADEKRRKNKSINAKTKIVSIRLPHSDVEYIDKISRQECVNRRTVISNILSLYREIEMLCTWGDINTAECCRQIGELFRSGRLVVKDGKLEVNE